MVSRAVAKRIMFGNLEGAVRRGRGGKGNGPIAYRATRPGVWYSGGLESYGVGNRGAG